MVDKNVVVPLYHQVANELRREINANRYGDSGCIGTHSELVKRFGVSIRTIRRAVQILAEEGLVDIQQGKGTYVHKPMFVDHLKDLTGISNMLQQMQLERKVIVPIFEVIDTPEWMEEDVKRAFGPQCTFLRRVVLYRERPTACADMYLPVEMVERFGREEVEKDTVYHILEQKLGMELGKGKQRIRAAGADADVAENLNIDLHAPVLEITRRAYDTDENLIEFMILTYVASMYCFEVELQLNKL